MACVVDMKGYHQLRGCIYRVLRLYWCMEHHWMGVIKGFGVYMYMWLGSL